MTITATLQTAPGKIQPVKMNILGDFDMTTDAIESKNMDELKQKLKLNF